MQMLILIVGLIAVAVLVGAGFTCRIASRRRQTIAAWVAAGVLLVGSLLGSAIVNIGDDEVGIVTKWFGGGPMPPDRIIAMDGENGPQARILTPGWHFYYWPWQYAIEHIPVIAVDSGQVGLLTAADGRPLSGGQIYAPEWVDTGRMLDAEYFLEEGEGVKGPQLTVLKPGKYRINSKLFTVQMAPVTNIRIGEVGVIKSNVGDPPPPSTEPAAPGAPRLVDRGQRGIWQEPYDPQQLYLHQEAYEIIHVSTLKATIRYKPREDDSARSAQAARAAQALSDQNAIMVRSQDGFTFPVDVRAIYHIEREDAPRLVATVGGEDVIQDRVVTPAIRAIFRNNAEKVKALEYVKNRSQQEAQSTAMLREALKPYGVTLDDLYIGDVGDNESLGELLRTQTTREIAIQEQLTFQEQQRAAEQKKGLTRTEQEAEEEKRLATARYAVQIAEQDKDKRIIQAQAEAQYLKEVATARAAAYEMIAEVIGTRNAALLDALRTAGDSGLSITPSVMVTGQGSGGMTDALMGTMLRNMLGDKEGPTTRPAGKNPGQPASP